MFPQFHEGESQEGSSSHALVEARPVSSPGRSNSERQATISELVGYYLGWGKVELNWSDDTLHSYADGMRWIGDIAPERINQSHVLKIKAESARRGVGSCRVRTHLAALKSF